MLSSVVSSQVDLHARYGGVVPEIASRAHVELLTPVIAESLIEAGIGDSDIDGVEHRQRIASLEADVPGTTSWEGL